MTVQTKMLGIGMTERNVPKVMSGDKTQTRRIEAWLRRIDDIYDHVDKMFDEENGEVWFRFSVSSDGATAYEDVKPRHQVGDRLYVKEALERHEVDHCYEGNDSDYTMYKCDKHVIDRPWESDDGKTWKNKVIPARYMPRSAARTFIEITDVRCERIQDISAEDVVAEGCGCKDCGQPLVPDDGAWACHKCEWMFTSDLVVLSFSDLWDDTNGKGAWERNDWTFAYTFKKVDQCPSIT